MFLDYWETLNSRFDEGDLPAHAQLVGYKLLGIFNERMFPKSLSISDRELQSRTNIKSSQTIVDARRRLKNAGLIDFQTAKAKPTRYQLLIKQDSSINQASGKQESSKRQTKGLVSYTVNASEAAAKEKESFPPAPPFKEKEKKEPSIHSSIEETGAREDDGGGSAHADAKPLRSPYADANDIQTVWAETFDYDLRGNRALELERLAGLDFARAEEAIRRTKRKELKEGTELQDPFRYFQVVYDGLTPKAATLEESPKPKDPGDETRNQFEAMKAIAALYEK